MIAGKWRKRAGWTLALGLLAGLSLTWLAGSAMTRANNTAIAPLPAPAQPVTIASADSITLAGSYWPAPRADAPAVLLLHGNGGNRRDVAEQAQWLSRQGYAVLAIDFRGHGASTPAGKSFGLFEARDARAAFAWLRARQPRARIGVIGFSLGGAAALLGAEGPLPADALVIESVYPDIRRAIGNRIASVAGRVPAALLEPLLSFQSLPRYGVWPSAISPVAAMRRVQAPVMVAGGGNDVFTPPAETLEMFEAAHRNGEVWLLEGLSHDQVVGAQSPAFRARLLSFLDRHLKPAKR